MNITMLNNIIAVNKRKTEGWKRQTNLRIAQTRLALVSVGFSVIKTPSVEGRAGACVERARGYHAAAPPPSRRRHPQPINSRQRNVEFVSPLELLPIDFPFLKSITIWTLTPFKNR